MSPFLLGVGFAIGPMVGVWAVSVAMRDASIVDAWWGPAFVVLTAGLMATNPAGVSDPAFLLLGMVGVWGGRLGFHLWRRNRALGEDYRYRAMREKHGSRFALVSLVTVFVLQGGLVWIVSLPLQAAIGGPRTSPTVVLTAVGVVIWAVGLVFETVADAQLRRFRADPTNQRAVLQTGLWRYTRHPNYFGDFLVWWGLYVVAVSVSHAWWTAVGPVVMSGLLMKVSGVGLLEATIATRRPGYAAYVARTNTFFPGPPRAG